jgi:hypothetical protein
MHQFSNQGLGRTSLHSVPYSTVFASSNVYGQEMVNKSDLGSDEHILAGVTTEMGKPRLALSARAYFRRHVVAMKPRFRDGEIVHNRFTDEDGRVLGSYDKKGVCMYAVSVLDIPRPREHAPYSSDWVEDCLEPSDKSKILMSPQAEALRQRICKS